MAIVEKHYHTHVHIGGLDEVLVLLKKQAKQISIIMATFQDFQDQLTAIATATTGISESTLNISEDLKRLADSIAKGGIDAISEEELLQTLGAAATKLSEASAKLKEVADINPEPTPESPVEG